MKKFFTIFIICLCLMVSMTGCSLGEVLERFVSAGDPVQETAPDKSRVYMDELRGTLTDFNGNQVTVQAEDQQYVFDVSQAAIECAEGMITGDEIIVIYEGQLNDTDTSAVKALKVADEYHKKTRLKDRTIQGTILDVTLNTITIKSKKGKTLTFPTTGAEQYYQNGLKTGAQIYLHYKGTLDADSSEEAYAGHLKVLSVSDIEPLKVPAPTPTPAPEENAQPANKLFCVINGISQNLLQVTEEGSSTALQLDLASVPSYFPGGVTEGSHVTVSYTGEFNGTTLEGIALLGITAENPASQRDSHISFRVTGTIIGQTVNTITIRTDDEAVLTFDTIKARNSSTGGLEEGCRIRITFNPSASHNSNIYSGLKIEDA